MTGYDSPEQRWWREQYANPTSPHSLGWIARWPRLARCVLCGKQLGHDDEQAMSSMHRCIDGNKIGGRDVKAQPRVEVIA